MPKGRGRVGQNGVVFTPPKTRAYELRVRTIAFYAARAAGWVFAPKDEYAVQIRIFLPDARLRDADNITKACLDAMNKVVFHDDAQVGELHVYRTIDRANPRIEVEIRRHP